MFKTLALCLGLLLSACSSTQSAVDTGAGIADLSLQRTTLSGESLDLDADLASGRAVVLVFWQSWCGACEREAPAAVAASKQLGERARFVGVVPGPDERVDEAEMKAKAEAWGLTYPTLRDRDLALNRAFGITGTPTIVVLRGEREVVYSAHRLPEDWEALLR